MKYLSIIIFLSASVMLCSCKKASLSTNPKFQQEASNASNDNSNSEKQSYQTTTSIITPGIVFKLNPVKALRASRERRQADKLNKQRISLVNEELSMQIHQSEQKIRSLRTSEQGAQSSDIAVEQQKIDKITIEQAQFLGRMRAAHRELVDAQQDAAANP